MRINTLYTGIVGSDPKKKNHNKSVEMNVMNIKNLKSRLITKIRLDLNLWNIEMG